jgi:hypothetical protein
VRTLLPPVSISPLERGRVYQARDGMSLRVQIVIIVFSGEEGDFVFGDHDSWGPGLFPSRASAVTLGCCCFFRGGRGNEFYFFLVCCFARERFVSFSHPVW